ncbi:MAG: hypothetical protein ACI9SP_003324 [Arenicella sp.]|jgi:hypothetical protein
MKTIIKFACAFTALFVLQSAVAEQPQGDELSSLSYSKHSHNRDIRNAKFWDLTSQSAVRKSKSKLKITNSGACLIANTKVVQGVNTTWWMIFNEPSNCSNPNPFGNGQKCGMADLDNPLTRGTLMWAAPVIVGPNEKANLNFCLGVGELSHAVMPLGTQEGLVFPKKAEYQLFVRTHGPGVFDDAQTLGEQINSLNGGCETDDQSGFACETLQILYHPAPNQGH